ncbi:MAG: hypothetical protein ABSC34_12140 [Acidimicrobiales bacterium]
MTVIVGVIESFDGDRGWGLLRGEGGRAFYFHCAEIADGSRTIGVGLRAHGARVVGRLGHDEVANVAPVD